MKSSRLKYPVVLVALLICFVAPVRSSHDGKTEVVAESETAAFQEGCTLFEQRWKENGCDHQRELIVTATNNCSTNVEVKVCVEKSVKTNGETYNCSQWGVRVGEKRSDWYCDGNPTGNYKHWVRVSSSREPFPNP